LLIVGEENLLPRVFTEVVIPEAVQKELLCNHAQLPAWLRIAKVQNAAQAGLYSKIIDAGEAETIELAQELHADRLLINERKGRKLAMQEGVAVVGLLGVVLLAKTKALTTSGRTLIERLDWEAACKSPLRFELWRSKRWANSVTKVQRAFIRLSIGKS